MERVNRRLDVFGFEDYFIRGQNLQVSLALMVMLRMALGRIQAKQKDNLRSFVARKSIPSLKNSPQTERCVQNPARGEENNKPFSNEATGSPSGVERPTRFFPKNA